MVQGPAEAFTPEQLAAKVVFDSLAADYADELIRFGILRSQCRGHGRNCRERARFSLLCERARTFDYLRGYKNMTLIRRAVRALMNPRRRPKMYRDVARLWCRAASRM
jgi:hypothetical protein